MTGAESPAEGDQDGAGAARLLMISGPIAAGKSTLAAAVCELLRAEGRTVALTDLDTVAEMALPTLPDWEWAHRIHADVVGAWLRSGIEFVVDEGTSTPGEVRQVLDAAPPGCGVFHVVLTADYAASLARAQGDPGRGLSRDPDFLRRHHEDYAAVVDQLPCDLRIDVESRAPDALAAQVVDAFGRHRPGAGHDLELRRSELIDVERTGTVRWFAPEKGYGRITADDGEVLFVHFSGIRMDGYRALREGQRVRFVWRGSSADHGRHAAEDVTVLD